jgi:transposase
MLGHKAKAFKTHPALCLEDLVPPDNFYRQLEAKLDLTFVRDLVRECYSSRMGRPSIDPVVFFKLQLIMFFEGFRSERQLMDQVNLNLAFRWYIGYDLDEPVPDHSSLSKIRDRYGLEVFQQFFEQMVERCIEAGLVWGKELYFDGTKVRANADIEGMVPRFHYDARQHLKDLFGPEEPHGAATGGLPADETESASPPRGFVEKYDGTRITARDRPWYERTTDNQVSPTDPDATPMKRFTGDKARLGYHTHYVVDGGKARIIMAVLVTPSSIMDNTPMLDLTLWTRFRWRLRPQIAVGDAKYGTALNIAGLERCGIQAFLATADVSARTQFYPVERFEYDPERDLYICPQGHALPLQTRNYGYQYFRYRADAEICQVCPVRNQCTTSQTGRTVHRSFFQSYLDRAAAYRATAAYQKAMRKRKLWPEPLFGEAKQWHGLNKFRLRRLRKVNIEGLMIAAGQNIKRLLSHKERSRPLLPASSQVLAVPGSLPYFSFGLVLGFGGPFCATLVGSI